MAGAAVPARFRLDHHAAYPISAADHRLAALLFFSEFRWVRSGNDHWYRLCRFFEKLLIINFAAGVATGITMEMAFGILYGPFSQAVGPFFGQVLGYETITAFMYEAGFIGLMIFGWGKISKRMHLFATFNVALSSAFSAMWILVANSWMQTPTGVEIHDGVFTVKDWWSALFNPDVIYGFPHMLVACIELGIAFVIGVSALYLLQRRYVPTFQKAFKYSMLVLVPVAALQIYLGDGMGLTVFEDQKPVLAAMEATTTPTTQTAASTPAGTCSPGQTRGTTATPGPSPSRTS